MRVKGGAKDYLNTGLRYARLRRAQRNQSIWLNRLCLKSLTVQRVIHIGLEPGDWRLEEVSRNRFNSFIFFPTKTGKPLKRFLDLKWAPVTGLKPGVNEKVELHPAFPTFEVTPDESTPETCVPNPTSQFPCKTSALPLSSCPFTYPWIGSRVLLEIVSPQTPAEAHQLCH